MDKAASLAEVPDDRTMTVERLIDAPRDLVFRAFTDPKHISRWWGPRGFRTTTHHMDLRTGGTWRYTMHGPDGTDYPNLMSYHAVEPPARLRYSHGTGIEGEPFLFEGEITLEERGSGTLVRLRLAWSSPELRAPYVEMGALEGAHDTLRRLSEEVAFSGGDALLVSRQFAASPEELWRAWTDPRRLADWFGPVGMSLEVLRHDLQPGGTFHYRMSGPGGADMFAIWDFIEVTEPGRLLWVLAFADEKGAKRRAPFSENWPMEMLTELTIEPDGAGSRVALRSQAYGATPAEVRTFREGRGSMEEGWGATLGVLREHLAKG